MAKAFFPDMGGVGVEAGWTGRNMALKRNGHDVGANDYDVVIHFDDCRKCAGNRAAQAEAEEMAYWDAEYEKYLKENPR